ncbi:hypothetical protein CTAYLR_002165 [Chrysophaeum taylorii]|uniref:Complex 1 LYR protein domain-containing protein n=1 Tax=Chrysophaeum taylorii TaxID=2483200 RepID=A0AAD7UNE0_9STRA|nr:hypothetical protein CTAYLR_002165 [Chrysophaeum taylorii]
MLHPTLGVYRRILFLAKRFPRCNRLKIIEEIRSEFRRNATLGPEEAKPCIQLAHDSIKQLQQYVSLDPAATSWNVKMTETPMPVPPEKK